jgi:hypothetical protein
MLCPSTKKSDAVPGNQGSASRRNLTIDRGKIVNSIHHIRRYASAVAAFTVTVISVLAAPAAFATRVPPPGTGDIHSHSSLPVHAITAGGMPGWQISLIAIGAGLIGAAGAFILAWRLASQRADTPARVAEPSRS